MIRIFISQFTNLDREIKGAYDALLDCDITQKSESLIFTLFNMMSETENTEL